MSLSWEDHVTNAEQIATLEETRNQLRMELLKRVLHNWADRIWSANNSYRTYQRHEFLWWDTGNLASKSLSDLLAISGQGEEATAKGELTDPPSRRFQCVRDSLAGRWKSNASGLCVLCLRTGEDHKLHETAQEKCQPPRRSAAGRRFAFSA